MKSRNCEFWRKCQLKRDCPGCIIPQKAKEHEYEMHLKTNYIRDTDYRGISQRMDVLGPIVKPFEKEVSNEEEV